MVNNAFLHLSQGNIGCHAANLETMNFNRDFTGRKNLAGDEYRTRDLSTESCIFAAAILLLAITEKRPTARLTSPHSGPVLRTSLTVSFETKSRGTLWKPYLTHPTKPESA